jgi:hypothetical protein
VVVRLPVEQGVDAEANSSAGFDISSISATISMNQYVKYFNSPDSVTQGGTGAVFACGTGDWCCSPAHTGSAVQR